MATKPDNSSEQVKFLVSCISHSNGGKVSPSFMPIISAKLTMKAWLLPRCRTSWYRFQGRRVSISLPFSIFTQLSLFYSQKRYERMLKANGVIKKPAAPPADGDDGEATPKKPAPKKRGAASAAGGTPAKKRATKGVKQEDGTDDEDAKPTPKRTPKPRGRKLKASVRKEENVETEAVKEGDSQDEVAQDESTNDESTKGEDSEDPKLKEEDSKDKNPKDEEAVDSPISGKNLYPLS